MVSEIIIGSNKLLFGRESDTLKYKKQRNRVNNMKKKAKENFESNLDNILLDNSTNPKTYWSWNTLPCYVQK
jgi:hypothetical protein